MKLPFAAGLFVLAIAFVIATALIPGAANAANTSANLTVTASVLANCTITGQTLDLGTYDPVVTNASSPLDVTDTNGIAVTCTKGHGVTIDADKGLNTVASACSTNRALKNGSNYLCYDMYTDSAGGSIIWGDGTTFGQPLSLTPTTALSPTTGTVYAEVPAGQDAVYAGSSYSDTVKMTVNF